MNKLSTQLLSGYLLVFGLIVMLGYLSYSTIESLTQISDDVSRSQQTITNMVRLEKLLVDMETGERGFLLTGSDEFLDPYNEAIRAYENELTNLQDLVADDPLQLSLLIDVDMLVERWHLSAGDPEIAVRRTMNSTSVNALTIEGMLIGATGKDILDEMRDVMDTLNLDFRADGNIHAELLVMAIAKSMVDQETGQRGFLITGSDEFLEPYESGAELFDKSIQELRVLVSNAHDRILIDDLLSQLRLIGSQWRNSVAELQLLQRRQLDLGVVDSAVLGATREITDGQVLLNEIEQEIERGIQIYAESENQRSQLLFLELARAIDEAESGLRQFVQTGSEIYSIQHYGAMQRFENDIRVLSQLNDNAYDRDMVVEKITLLETLADSWRNLAGSPEIATRRAMNVSDSTTENLADLIRSSTGKDVFDAIRMDILEFVAAEEASLTLLSAQSVSTVRSSYFYTIAGTTTAILIGLAAAWIVLRRILYSVGGEPREIAKLTKQVALGNIDFSRVVEAPTGILASLYSLAESLKFRAQRANEIASGNYTLDLPLLSDRDVLGTALRDMTLSLSNSQQLELDQSWLHNGELKLAEKLRGQYDLSSLSEAVISFLAKYLDAQLGSLYLLDVDDPSYLSLSASYAFNIDDRCQQRIQLGQGVAGQAAQDKELLLLRDIPEGYIHINSTLGDAQPACILAVPLILNEELVGVVELASLEEFTELKISFLNTVFNSIAITLRSTQERLRLALSEEQTRALIDTAVDSIITMDDKGIIVSVNEAAIGLFGYAYDELVGADVNMLTPSPLFGSIEVLGKQQEVEAVHKDGTIIPVILSVGEVVVQGRRVFNAFIQDVSELRRNADEIKQQNEILKAQQEDLARSNTELEEQQQQIELQNIDLVAAQSSLKQRALQLEQASQYKSEFLANMSHELRTPLNSLLILSQLLAQNKDGNLTEKQTEALNTIHDSGDDLLALINDILDLAKVESGKIELLIESTALQDIASHMTSLFAPLCGERSIKFEVDVSGGLPNRIDTDEQRLSQIIKNLVSNAVKFTPDGGRIELRFFEPESPNYSLAIEVRDTGMGIAQDKLESIFEAFQQADGSTSRKFGGTGLGLSISTELALALGGKLSVESTEGVGSSFTLYLGDPGAVDNTTDSAGPPSMPPVVEDSEARAALPVPAAERPDVAVVAGSYIEDDKDIIQADDNVVLIVEDDSAFAEVLGTLARERGFKFVATNDGETALQLVSEYTPKAILLDIGLAGMDGWAVMSRLKENIKTRHIPVHFMTAADEPWYAMQLGAAGYLRKPLNVEQVQQTFSKIEHVLGKAVKDLLLVSSDTGERKEVMKTTGNGDIKYTNVSTGKEAQLLLHDGNIDCIVILPDPQDMTTIELLRSIEADEAARGTPIVVYSKKSLPPETEKEISKISEKMTVHRVNSPGMLLDETVLFLHRIEENLPAVQRQMLEMVHDKESILKDKKILLTDDDMRNVYALSAALEEKGMLVIVARDGQQALDQLEEHSDIDLVLMDIMMPVMDGYEAMTEIRKMPQFERLPIIALTAKALKADRHKCLAAGASDYLTKPVDLEKLTSMLRVWLYS